VSILQICHVKLLLERLNRYVKQYCFINNVIICVIHEGCLKGTRDYSTWQANRNSTSNSSADEIANVNFLYDDIAHALENTIDSCINFATDCFLQRRFTKFR